MSKPRPFIRYNQSTSMQDCSDRTTRLKQRTMYGGLANNVTNWGEKTNGSVKYLGNYKKKNVKYSEPTVTESGCLVNAPSSSSFLDLSKGMYYCHRNDIQRDYTMNLSGKSWQGPFLQIDTGMTPGVTTWFHDANNEGKLTAKFNAISTAELAQETDINAKQEQNLVDPNYDLFYEPCISEDNEPFRSYYKYANTEVYKDTYPYLEAIKKRYLKGFSFPSSVKFNYTEQLSGFKTEAQLSVTTDGSGTMTITLVNPGSGYTTKPTATLTADNTDWYGCATCDEEIIGTPSSAPIFTYDHCSQVDSSGGLMSQTGIGLTSQYPKPIFACGNNPFNIIIDDPHIPVMPLPFGLYWDGDQEKWKTDVNEYLQNLDLTHLNNTYTDSNLPCEIIVRKPVYPGYLIGVNYPHGGNGYIPSDVFTSLITSSPFQLIINEVNCNTVINLSIDASACLTSPPTQSNQASYTYTLPPEGEQAIGYGIVTTELNIQITTPGKKYNPIVYPLVVTLDPSGTIYEGGDLIDYANTLLNDRLATNNKGQVTLNNSTTGTLSLPCCTFNNIIGYSISLSGTARRYAKDIEQTCGPYCQETPKLCDPGDADSSYISCNADTKWNCCPTIKIYTPQQQKQRDSAN